MSGSLWVVYQYLKSVHNFVENNQLQIASSCFMQLLTEIVKHALCDALVDFKL